MTSVGPNANFLNTYFEATHAEPSDESLSNIFVADQNQTRKSIASKYLATKFKSVEQMISNQSVILDDADIDSLDNLRQDIQKGNASVFIYMGVLFNRAAKSFKKLFADFNEVIKNLDSTTRIIATTGIPMTPLNQIIEAGIDSASHIWEAVLKSILIKQGKNITKEEFMRAYETSKKLLLDITDIPLQVLAIFESYMFNRTKAYHCLNFEEQVKERMGSNVNHEALTYDSETGAVSLNQEFMNKDTRLAYYKQELHTLNNESLLKIHSCAGKQIIPLFFRYMDQIFKEHLLPYFDDIVWS